MWNACGRCGAARRLAKPIKNTVANDWLHVIYIYIRNNNERNGNRWSWPYLLPQGPFQLFTASNYLYEMYLHTPFERAEKKIVYVVSVFFFCSSIQCAPQRSPTGTYEQHNDRARAREHEKRKERHCKNEKEPIPDETEKKDIRLITSIQF